MFLQKEISKLHHVLIIRYGPTKTAKLGIFPAPKGIYREPKIQPFHLNLFLVIGSSTVNIHTKFQLDIMSCSRDIFVTRNKSFIIVDCRAFCKNSMKNQWFNIF